MSLTTFKDLIDEAERVLTEIVTRPTLDPGSLIAAWPDFHRQAVHALSAATGARPARWYAADHLIAKTAPPRVAQTRSRVPDPAMLRAAQLLGAAGDLLDSAPRISPDDALLHDEPMRAAQGRIATILAAGAHLLPRAVAEAEEAGRAAPKTVQRVVGHAAYVEQLAASVIRHSPGPNERAEDLAVLVDGLDRATLEEVVERWAVQARDTLRTRHPSARDLQGLGGDLAQVSAHSRVLVRAAAHAGALDLAVARALDVTLGRATMQWLDATKAWEGLHTTTGAAPGKIATSHELARALAAVTREGKEWSSPAVVADRLEPELALRVVRRGQEVARETAGRQWPLATALVHAGMMFVAPKLAAATVENLAARQHGRLLPATAGEHDPALRQLAALRIT